MGELDIGPVERFLTEVERLSNESISMDVVPNYLSSFFNEIDELTKEAGRSRSSSFNIFSILKIERDELRNSAFLAWLLDPLRGPWEAPEFLGALLRSLAILEPGVEQGRYRVRTEYSAPMSRFDIVIYEKEKFLLLIENKIGAPEGSQQLLRERHDADLFGDSLNIPKAHRHLLFLTPDGRMPETDDPQLWKSVSHLQLADAFEARCGSVGTPKLKNLVLDWGRCIRGGVDD